MIAFLVIIVLLAVLGVLGAVIEGLLWLTGLAFLLVVGAAAFGYFKFRTSTRSAS